MNLPTRKEWEAYGFLVPDELCSKPDSTNHQKNMDKKKYTVSFFLRRTFEVAALDEINALEEAAQLLSLKDRKQAQLAQVHGYDKEPHPIAQEDKENLGLL